MLLAGSACDLDLFAARSVRPRTNDLGSRSERVLTRIAYTTPSRIDLLFVVKTVLGVGVGARAICPWARVVGAS
jgi:hypothetical protein